MNRRNINIYVTLFLLTIMSNICHGQFNKDTDYKIISKASGRGLDIEGGSKANGAKLQQWDFVGTEHQLWQLHRQSDGTYKIISKASGRGLDVENGSRANGAKVQQWDFAGTDHQLWRIEPHNDGTYKIISKASGRGLDVENGSRANGAKVQQWDFAGTDHQLWRIEPYQKPSVLLSLPSGPAQNDDWSCGPNSAIRFLGFYGQNLKYSDFKRWVRSKQTHKSILGFDIADLFNKMKIGTAPHHLRDAIRDYRPETTLKRETSFNTILDVLEQGKPIIALLRVGSADVALMTAPALHWVVLTGYDLNAQKIFYTNTNDLPYEMSFSKFKREWDWSVGSGLVKEALEGEGVTARTIIY